MAIQLAGFCNFRLVLMKGFDNIIIKALLDQRFKRSCRLDFNMFYQMRKIEDMGADS
jgi:hypothetical protein